MAAARFGCKRAMVGTGWANSHVGCMNMLRKRYSHELGVPFGREGFFDSERVFAKQGC